MHRYCFFPHIFESFTREEKTTINSIQGTGLGLAITAKIVEMMGGPYSSLPVIAMSANAYEEDVRDSLAAGMDGHIAKPFDPAELLRVLHRYIKEK